MSATKSGLPRASAAKHSARGRPPAHRAGEVDARILEAATTLFLARGFEGASCEQVATMAGCGKASIYARYADKTELFEAMMRSKMAAAMELVPAPLGRTSRDRLVAVCTEVLQQSLAPESVALMRLLIAEGARFPELVAEVERSGREHAVRRVADVLAGGKSDRKSLDRATTGAGQLIELTFAPLQLRALLGESLQTVQGRVRTNVAAAVAMLGAAGVLDL